MIAQIVLRLVMRDVDIVFIPGSGRNSIYSYCHRIVATQWRDLCDIGPGEQEFRKMLSVDILACKST